MVYMIALLWYILLVVLPIYFGCYRNNLVLNYRLSVINRAGVEEYRKLPSYRSMLYSVRKWPTKKLRAGYIETPETTFLLVVKGPCEGMLLRGDSSLPIEGPIFEIQSCSFIRRDECKDVDSMTQEEREMYAMLYPKHADYLNSLDRK